MNDDDITRYHQCHDPLEWYGCYASDIKYKQYIDKSTSAHPAKMSLSLCDRIFQHLKELGLLKEGDTVIDFMSGTARTGIIASLHGCKFVGVELEPHFIDMSNGYDCDGTTSSETEEGAGGWDDHWELSFKFGWEPDIDTATEYPTPEDAKEKLKKAYQAEGLQITVRRVVEKTLDGENEKETYIFNCAERDDIAVLRFVPAELLTTKTICKYKCGLNKPHPPHHVLGNKGALEKSLNRKVEWELIQGDARKLSELLKARGYVGVVSPPYVCPSRPQNQRSYTLDELDDRRGYKPVGGFRAGYGTNPDNIGNLNDKPLVGVVSPPYTDQPIGVGSGNKVLNEANARYTIGSSEWKDYLMANQQTNKDKYSDDPHNIGNLKDKPLVGVVSPPYQAGIGDYKTKRDDFVAWIQNELKTKGYIEWQGQTYTEKEWRKMNYGRIDGRVMDGSPKMGTEGYNPSNPLNIGNLPDKPLVGVVSPPFAGQNQRDITKERYGSHVTGGLKRNIRQTQPYTDNSENIGNLRDKPLVGVVSPPYAESMDNTGNRHGDSGICGRDPKMTKMRYDEEGSPKNIGNLRDAPLVGITSPPYADIMGRESHEGSGAHGKGIKPTSQAHYSKGKDNIGHLQDKQLVGVVSPPYSNPRDTPGTTAEDDYDKNRDLVNPCGRGTFRGRYGEAEGQIGNLKDKLPVGIPHPLYSGETHIFDENEAKNRMINSPSNNSSNIDTTPSSSYLEAMLVVYSEAKKSGISPLVCVVKCPTRNGVLRRLDLDTIMLLQNAGYTIYDYHRAILFEEQPQATFDGDTFKVPKGRLSFFKRLAYTKGSPVARWEDIIFAVIE